MPYMTGTPLIDIPANLPHVFDLRRTEFAPDVLGGDVSSTVAVASSIRCFVQNASQDEKDEFQKRGFEVTHKLYVSAADAAGIREDNVLVNLRPSSHFPAGMILKVRSVADKTVNLAPTLSKIMATATFGDQDN